MKNRFFKTIFMFFLVIFMQISVLAKEQITLNNAEISTLTSIAFQCPYVGGNAVFKARVLYEHFNGAAIFSDECRADAPRIAAAEIQQNVLFPNPANDYIILRLPESYQNELLDLQVRNAQGITVLSQAVSSRGEIDTSDLPAGFYTFSIKNKQSNVLIALEKVILSK